MGKLFIVTGHSGAGKTAVMRKTGLQEIVSVTTRQPRYEDGEVDGRDYYFVSRQEFDNSLQNGELAEHIIYATGDAYGVWKDELDRKLKHDDAYIIAEQNGMKQLKELYPDAVTIYLYTTQAEAYSNMIKRGDDRRSAQKRTELYEEAFESRKDYDYVIKNVIGNMDATVNIIRSIVSQNTCLVQNFAGIEIRSLEHLKELMPLWFDKQVGTPDVDVDFHDKERVSEYLDSFTD